MNKKKKMKIYYTNWYVKAELYIEVIFMIICSIISMFILKKNYLMYIPLFLLSELLYLSIREVVSFFWELFYWKQLSLENKRSLLLDMKQDLGRHMPETDLMCDVTDDVASLYCDLIAELNGLIEERDKVVEETPTEIESFVSVTKEFKNKIKTNNENFDFINGLYNKLDKIIDLLKKTPDATVFANKLFNIYLPETILLLNKTRREQKEENYVEDLNTVLTELDKLADTTIKTVERFNNKSTEISFDVLIREIQRTEEELNGKCK